MKYSNKHTGIKRIYLATANSIRAMRWLCRHEAAFRQELLLGAILIAFSLYLDVTFGERLILWSALLFVLLVEAINTAIEVVVDRIGIEHHELSGLAKDIGSLAVMLSLIICGAVWLAVII